MIGIGKTDDKEPQMNDEGAGDEVCIPVEKLKIDDGENQVEPAVGDVVNPDMKITRIENGNAYMVAVDAMKDETEPSMDDQEASLRSQAEQADKMGAM